MITTPAYGGETCGIASWYGPGFHGKRTASGEIYNQNELTAAHLTLDFGTRVRIINPSNGNQVTVRITDRGPYHGSRIIDVSRATAHALDFVDKGVTKLCLKVISTD